MKNRIAVFVAASLLTCSIYQFGCGGGGGVTEPPPPPPFYAKTILIFGQEMTKSTSVSTLDKTGANDCVFDENGYATAGALCIPPEKNPDKEVGIFAKDFTSWMSDTVQDTNKTQSEFDSFPMKRISPKGSFLVIGKPAPNGDVFLISRAGLFISNPLTGESRLLSSTQDLFSNLLDGLSKDALKQQSRLLYALQSHWARASSAQIYASFFPVEDSYVAILTLDLKKAVLALKYDAKTGQLEKIFPYTHNFVIHNKDIVTCITKPAECPAEFIVTSPEFNSITDNKPTFTTELQKKGPVKFIALIYDPATKKIGATELPHKMTRFIVRDGKIFYIDYEGGTNKLFSRNLKDVTDFFSSKEKLAGMADVQFDAPQVVKELPELSKTGPVFASVYGNYLVTYEHNASLLFIVDTNDGSVAKIDFAADKNYTISATKDGPVLLFMRKEASSQSGGSSGMAAQALAGKSLGYNDVIVNITNPTLSLYTYNLQSKVEKKISNAFTVYDTTYPFFYDADNPSYADPSYSGNEDYLNKQRGISYDGEWAFIQIVKDMAKPSELEIYKKNLIIDASESKTDGPLGAGWTLAIPPVEKKYYHLILKSNRRLVWNESSTQPDNSTITSLLFNSVINETPTAIDSQISAQVAYGAFVTNVFIEPKPMDSAVKFDIASDPNTALACVKDSANAKLCPKATQACMSDGVCREMLNCSAEVPDGICPVGKKCDHGQCISTTICAPYPEPTNGTCPEGYSLINGCCGSIVACTPQCDGKSCGSDGCGGSCGTCPYEGDFQKCGNEGKCINFPKELKLTATRVTSQPCTNPTYSVNTGRYTTTCKYSFSANFTCQAAETEQYKYAFHKSTANPTYQTVSVTGNASEMCSISTTADLNFTGTKTLNTYNWTAQTYIVSMTDSTLNTEGTIYTSEPVTINKE